jgi:hypothetical protein
MHASPAELLRRVIALHTAGDIDDAEFERLTLALMELPRDASAPDQGWLGETVNRGGESDGKLTGAALLTKDAIVQKEPPIGRAASAMAQCGNCGGYLVSRRQSRQGDIMTASVLLTFGIMAGPTGFLTLFVTPFGPAEWLRLPVPVSLVLLLFGAICLRGGYRAGPRGPVYTTYKCNLCGYTWEAGQSPPARLNPDLLRLAQEERRRLANSDAVAIIDHERHRRE